MQVSSDSISLVLCRDPSTINPLQEPEIDASARCFCHFPERPILWKTLHWRALAHAQGGGTGGARHARALWQRAWLRENDSAAYSPGSQQLIFKPVPPLLWAHLPLARGLSLQMYICQQKASMAAAPLLEHICPLYWIIQLRECATQRRRRQNLTAGRRCAGINEPSVGRKQVSLNVNHRLLAHLAFGFCPPPVYSGPEEASLFATVSPQNVSGLNWGECALVLIASGLEGSRSEIHYESKYPSREQLACGFFRLKSGIQI